MNLDDVERGLHLEPLETTRRELLPPVAWDMSWTRTGPELRPRSDEPFPHAVRLRDDVRLRVEPTGAIVQLGTFVWALDSAGRYLLELMMTSTPTSTIATTERAQSILRGLRDVGVVVADRAGTRSRARRIDAAKRNDDVPSTPRTLELEITNKCFRHCSYCAYGSGPTPLIGSDEELSTDEWLRIIEDLDAAGVTAVEFTGGDPFARDDALELIRATSEHGIGVLINSDLSVLSDSMVAGMSELENLVAVQTSLDGASPETTDLTRGRGGHKLLLKQLRILREARLPVRVGMTVHRNNMHEVRAIARLAAEHDVDGLFVGPMYAAGRGRALASIVLDDEEWDAVVRDFARVIVEGVIEPTHANWHDLAHRALQGEAPAHGQVGLSPRGTSSLRIDPRGNAYVSAKLREAHPRFETVGNVVDLPLDAVWNHSRRLNELRGLPATSATFDAIHVDDVPTVSAPRPRHVDRLQAQRASA